MPGWKAFAFRPIFDNVGVSEFCILNSAFIEAVPGAPVVLAPLEVPAPLGVRGPAGALSERRRCAAAAADAAAGADGRCSAA